MELPQESSKGAAQEPLQTLQGPAGKNTNANLFPEVRATSVVQFHRKWPNV